MTTVIPFPLRPTAAPGLFDGPSDSLGSKCGIPTPGPVSVASRPVRKARRPVTAEDAASRIAARRRRFDLQRIASSCLHEKDTHWKDQHRTVWCHRGTHRTADRTLPVIRSATGLGARLADVVTCGQGWTCPVCAAKIAETRRAEMRLGMERWTEAGGSVYLLSLTLPHTADQSCSEVLAQLLDARVKWKNAKKVKAILSAAEGSAQAAGSITALEVTVGWNGWHPHLHMLTFARRTAFGEGPPAENGDLSSRDIDTLRLEWVRILMKVGACQQAQAADVYRHGLNVRGGDKAAEYLAKYGEDCWDLSREVASAHAKLGVRGTEAGFRHFSPFQLLAIADCEGPHRVQARAMFREFAAAFAKRRMLTWSPGLKARVGIADLSDEDIAAELALPVPGEEFQVAELTHAQFGILTATRSLGAFLEYVALECSELHIAQDLIDTWIETRAAPGIDRHSPLYLRRNDSGQFMPARYHYDETDGQPSPDTDPALSAWSYE